MIIDNNGRYVYYLILDGTVVYVGQTTNVTQRMFTHKSDKGKIYDSFMLLPVSGDMGLLESEFIDYRLSRHRLESLCCRRVNLSGC